MFDEACKTYKLYGSAKYGTGADTVFLLQAFRQRKSLANSANDSFMGSTKCLETGIVAMSR
jgi:hypothetical protein